MKVCYIIMPFENAEYLIRCVNSLYRQLGDDFEVILAENVLDENALQFLAEKPQVKRISDISETDIEKLSEAASLISEDCEYVQLLDVTTVVSPICTKAILGLEKSDIIIPAVAIKKGDGFVVDNSDAAAVQKKFDGYSPLRFCYGRELFNKFISENAEYPESFQIFVINVFSGQYEIGITEDVCMYASSFAPQNANLDFETVNKNCNAIFARLFDIADVEAQVMIFEKLLSKLLPFLSDKNIEVRQPAFNLLHFFSDTSFERLSEFPKVETRVVIFEKILNATFPFLSDESIEIRQAAFDAIREFYQGVQNNFLFRSLIESKVGFETDDFLSMDYEEYTLYKTHVHGAKNVVTQADNAAQNKLLKDMKASLDSAKKEIVNLKNETACVKKEVAAVKSKPVFIPTAQNNLSNPSVEVPRLYREGRLGFKTIWKSFCGWLKYKFGGKK